MNERREKEIMKKEKKKMRKKIWEWESDCERNWDKKIVLIKKRRKERRRREMREEKKKSWKEEKKMRKKIWESSKWLLILSLFYHSYLSFCSRFPLLSFSQSTNLLFLAFVCHNHFLISSYLFFFFHLSETEKRRNLRSEDMRMRKWLWQTKARKRRLLLIEKRRKERRNRLELEKRKRDHEIEKKMRKKTWEIDCEKEKKEIRCVDWDRSRREMREKRSWRRKLR